MACNGMHGKGSNYLWTYDMNLNALLCVAMAGLSPRASLHLSASPRSNTGDLANGTTQGVGSPSGSGRLMQNGLTQNGLSPDGKPTASGNPLDQPPPMLNGHHHGGLANRNGSSLVLDILSCLTLFFGGAKSRATGYHMLRDL